jgi:hypothetical protein
VIFSHVLYQLSYLAQPASLDLCHRDEKPARHFGGAGGPNVGDADAASDRTGLGRAIAGAGFEPATSGL